MLKLTKRKWFRIGSVAIALAVISMLSPSVFAPNSELRLDVRGFLSFGADVRISIVEAAPGEVISMRTANSKTTYLGGSSYAWDGTIGSIHYEDNGWQEIDNEFLPAMAPWDWQMLNAGYHIMVKEDFTAGQILEFEVQGETVQLQPMSLEWTNDLDQIQQISMPQNVSPVITNPEVDLLPAVGVPSHQGTIRWNDAYGEGIDFEWKATSTRLLKILEIENFNKLLVPQQYILDGGNPVLRLNLIFDPPRKQDVDILVDGQVWNQNSKVQTFSVIEFVKDGEVLWGFMPLRYWGSYPGEDEALREANEGQSIATLEKRGNKLYISIRVPYDWLQTAVYPVFIDTDVNEQVGTSSDDVDRRLEVTPYFSLTYQNQWAGYLASTIYKVGGGMRFTSIPIPQGATIDTAYLQLRSYNNYSVNDVNTRISAEDVDDAVTFANDGAAFDTRYSNHTTAIVNWDAIPAWGLNEEGPDTTSPEIKTVIQEIVDRGGWLSGQAMVIFWEDFDNRSSQIDNAVRRAYSYNSSTTYAPKIHIEYSGGNEAPTVTTSAATNVGDTSATLVGDITFTGGANATVRGFEWDTDTGAPYANDWSENGDFGIAQFTHGLTSLTESNQYFYRAYATNTAGTTYGNEVTFFTTGATYTSQYPPAQSDTYVKATTKNGTRYWPYFATDPALRLTGHWADNSWIGATNSITNQRFHIDLGDAEVIERIYYENAHSSGGNTTSGVQNFTFWGSNSAGSFADLVWGSDSGWTELSVLTNVMLEHVALDQADPQYIVVVNSTAYRYYAFKFADNYGNVNFLAVRRIELQTRDVAAEADISNAPSSIAFGVISASSDNWSNGSAPTWPLDDAECYFTVTNNSSGAVSITIKATNFTGGVGWTLASSPGTNTVTMRAGKSGDANEAAMITLTTSEQAFISGLAASSTMKWEILLEAPTSVTDGVGKSSTVTLTATLD